MLIWGIVGSLGAFGAVISLQPPAPGGELRIPVVLQGDDEDLLAGIQFDLHYDPVRYELVAVDPGGAALEAGKEVVYAETTPGAGRVLVTGFNDTEIADGHVATLVLRPRTVSDQEHAFSLDRMMATDPDGNAVPLDYDDVYGYPPAPPEDPDNEPESKPTDTPEATPEEPEFDDGDSTPVPDPGEPTDAGGAGTGALRTPYPLLGGENSSRGIGAADNDAAAERAGLGPRSRGAERGTGNATSPSSARAFPRESARETWARSGGSAPENSAPPRTGSIALRPTGSAAPGEAPQSVEGSDQPRHVATAAPGPRLARVTSTLGLGHDEIEANGALGEESLEIAFTSKTAWAYCAAAVGLTLVALKILHRLIPGIASAKRRRKSP